ncbi:MAG: hypothetical protein ABFD89_00785 [Bryobacteraceae bacterium]
MSYQYISDPHLQCVTLGSAYTAGSGSMTLTTEHGSRLPSSGTFWLEYPRSSVSDAARIWKVTARSGDTISVTCETVYSADANLDSGSTLAAVFDVKALDQLRADLCQTGALASASAEKAGNLYLPTDSQYMLRDTGSAFGCWGPIQKLTPPPSSGWTWDNLGSSAVDYTNGYPYLCCPRLGAAQLSLLYRTAPSTPYAVKFLLSHDISGAPPGSSGSAGATTTYFIGFRDSAGKILEFGAGYTTSGPSIRTYKWASSSSASAVQTDYKNSAAGDIAWRNPCWMAIADDGTNLRTYWSIDGQHWKQFDSVSRTNLFSSGPTQYCLGGYANGCAVELAAISLEEVASGTL